MATYKSDIIKKKDALDISGKSLSGDKTGARVLYATAEYVFKPEASAPTEANGDVIELAEIPAGATVVPELSYVSKSFGYRNFRITLGDETDDDRFGSVQSIATSPPEGVGAFNYDYPSQAFFGCGDILPIPSYAETTRVVATLSEISSSIPAQSKLRFGIAYRVQG